MLNKRKMVLRDFFTVQDRLNEVTLPGWRDVLTVQHFQTAMFDECSELLNSTSWKWWKKQDTDEAWNLKVEAIDILHFSLSILILKGLDTSTEPYLDEQISFGYDQGEVREVPLLSADGTINHDEFITQSVSILGATDTAPFDSFFRSVGLSSVEISAIYVAKSTLNEIRQNNGYKSGEYQKMKGLLEDNQLLQEIVESYIADETQTLMNLMANIYKELDGK